MLTLSGRANPMTQHYLAGELSLLLAQLRAATTSQATASQIDRLRRRAETLPLTALPFVTVSALGLTDDLCWESLAQGDAVAFSRQAAISAELHEFGVCAGLLDEG